MRISSAFLTGVFLGIVGTLAVTALLLAWFAPTAFLTGIQAFGSVAVAFGAITAYTVYRANSHRQESEDRRAHSEQFLREACRLLDRASEIFGLDAESPPVSERRLIWISAARMIERFKYMRRRVTEPDHHAVANEHEEYARLRFFSVLNAWKDELTTDYFKGGDTVDDREKVERKSLAVIFDFAKWPDDAEDPLESIDSIELVARGAVPIDFHGVEDFLAEDQDYWEELAQRKDQYAQNEN